MTNLFSSLERHYLADRFDRMEMSEVIESVLSLRSPDHGEQLDTEWLTFGQRPWQSLCPLNKPVPRWIWSVCQSMCLSFCIVCITHLWFPGLDCHNPYYGKQGKETFTSAKNVTKLVQQFTFIVVCVISFTLSNVSLLLCDPRGVDMPVKPHQNKNVNWLLCPVYCIGVQVHDTSN